MLKILALVIIMTFLVANRAQLDNSTLTPMDALMSAFPCGKFPKLPDREPYNRLKRDGSVTAYGALPWHGGIFYRPTNTLMCSGVLLSDRHVLTSGFCPTPLKIDANIEVRLGDWDISNNYTSGPELQPFVSRNIARVVYYPDDTTRVALLTLSKPVDFGTHDFISPVCLPTLHQIKQEDPNRQCFVSGWGYKSLNESKYIVKYREHLRSKIEHPASPYGQGVMDFFQTRRFYQTLYYNYFNKSLNDPYANTPAVNVANVVPRSALDQMAFELGVDTAPWVGIYLNIPDLDEQPEEMRRRPRKYETVEDFNPPLDSFPYRANVSTIIEPAVQKILDYYPKPLVHVDEVGDVRLFNIYWDEPVSVGGHPNREASSRRYTDFDAQEMFPWRDSTRDRARDEGLLYRQKEKYREGRRNHDPTYVVRVRTAQELAIRQLRNYIRAKVVERLMPIGFRPKTTINQKIDFNKEGLSPYLKWQDVKIKENCPGIPNENPSIEARGKSCIAPVPRDENHAKDICLADLGSPVVCMDSNAETPKEKRSDDSDTTGPAYLAGVVTWKRPCFKTSAGQEDAMKLNLTLIEKTNETMIEFLKQFMAKEKNPDEEYTR